MFDRALGCADARRRLLLRNHARLERRRDCDRALIDCGSAVVAVLDGSARGGLNPELLWVMLDGQRLSIDWVRNCWYWLAVRTPVAPRM